MAVRIDVSVASEIAGSSGRSRSKRPTISAAKCCASAAEPPLPHARILPSASRQSVIIEAARAMCGAMTSTAASLSCALSAKWARMRCVVSIGPNCSNFASVDIDPAQPFDVLGGETIEEDRIETAWRLASEAAEIMLRGEPEASTLRRGNAFRCAAECPIAPQADLDEDQGLAVTNDEVDLACAAAI